MQVSGTTGLPHPDMRDRRQVTARMTEQFAQDLNILMSHYGITDASNVVRESVAAQADYVRQQWGRKAEREAARQAALQGGENV